MRGAGGAVRDALARGGRLGRTRQDASVCPRSGVLTKPSTINPQRIKMLQFVLAQVSQGFNSKP